MSMRGQQGINGDAAVVQVDRGVIELRRGRAVAIDDSGNALVAASVETASFAVLHRLLEAAAGRAKLFVTAERALAAGLTRELDGPVGIPLPADVDLETLRALGGIGGGSVFAGRMLFGV